MGGFTTKPPTPLSGWDSFLSSITDTIIIVTLITLAKAISLVAIGLGFLANDIVSLATTDTILTEICGGLIFIIKAVYQKLLDFESFMGGVVDFLKAAINGIIRIIKDIWNRIIRDGFIRVFRHIRDLRNKVANLLGPLLKYLKHVRDFWDLYFNRTIRPLLNLIQRLRSVLLVFRLLGFKWAARLDARLFALETRIARLFLDTRGQINRILGYINYILDPTGLLTVPLLIGSLRQAIGDAWAQLKSVGQHPLGASELEQIKQNKYWESKQFVPDQLTAAANGQPGDVQPWEGFAAEELGAAAGIHALSG